jgi:hypothetical protein
MPTYTEFLGGSPVEEDCAQIGSKSYDGEALNRLECEAYLVALERKYGDPPNGCRLLVKYQEHDFGGYYEVILHYNGSEEATAYCQQVEAGLSTWREAGMQAPVVYGPPGHPPTVIRYEPADWILQDEATAK